MTGKDELMGNTDAEIARTLYYGGSNQLMLLEEAASMSGKTPAAI